MHLHTWRDSVHVSASGVEGHISRASGHHGFKFGTVTRKICTPSIWILIHATLLAFGISKWLLEFWKIIVTLLCDVGSTVCGVGQFCPRLALCCVVRRCYFWCVSCDLVSAMITVLMKQSDACFMPHRSILPVKGRDVSRDFLECAKSVNWLCLNSTFSVKLLSLVLFLFCWVTDRWRFLNRLRCCNHVLNRLCLSLRCNRPAIFEHLTSLLLSQVWRHVNAVKTDKAYCSWGKRYCSRMTRTAASLISWVGSLRVNRTDKTYLLSETWFCASVDICRFPLVVVCWGVPLQQYCSRIFVQLLRDTSCLLACLFHGAVFLEKPTGFQLVKKFPTFYGTRRFITAFTSTRHLSLSWASSIQSIHPASFFSFSVA